jgi:hypothetical protein
MKPTQWTSTHQGAFQWYQECDIVTPRFGLEDLNVTNKTKKQPFFHST